MVRATQIRDEIVELTELPKENVNAVLKAQFLLLKRHMANIEVVAPMPGIQVTPFYKEESTLRLPTGEMVSVPGHYNFRASLSKTLRKIDRVGMKFREIPESDVKTPEDEEGYDDFA